jgi:hypothetical protein
MKRLLACSGLVLVPFLFESYTFHLYVAGEPAFFVFSGFRLWVFLVAQLSLGFVVGRVARPPLFVSSAIVAAATAVLIALLYQFCDPRQCYHSSPDGAGWLRLGVLFFSTASVGLLIGAKSRRERHASGIDAVASGTLAAVFLGYYPAALLSGTFLTYQTGLAVLAFALTLPFLFAGIASSMLSARKIHAVCSAVFAWALLSAMFAGARPEGVPVFAAMLPAGVALALAGFKAGRYLSKEKAMVATFSSLIALFLLVAAHSFADAPMNLSFGSQDGAIAEPTYYAGAYHDKEYFPTKRIEVKIDLESVAVGKGDFVLAGIGAQSPNCCKDGLDYGYRADVLVNDTGRYLVARAWETCDQNIACSGYPWANVMHEQVVPINSSSQSIMLAAEWRDKTVDWYYNIDGEWRRYSSFSAPGIENPYFNLGVIWVGSPFTNGESKNAYFYQAGVSTNHATARITFDCPAYYDSQGTKHCASLEQVKGSDSHWKVMWKWGVPHPDSSVEIKGESATVTLR